MSSVRSCRVEYFIHQCNHTLPLGNLSFQSIFFILCSVVLCDALNLICRTLVRAIMVKISSIYHHLCGEDDADVTEDDYFQKGKTGTLKII